MVTRRKYVGLESDQPNRPASDDVEILSRKYSSGSFLACKWIPDFDEVERIARNNGLLTFAAIAALKKLREGHVALTSGERNALRSLLNRVARAGVGSRKSNLGAKETSSLESAAPVDRRDWAALVDEVHSNAGVELRIRMGSAGSAQVTRVRLLQEWKDLAVRTEGSLLILSRASTK